MGNYLPQAVANEFLRRRASTAWPSQMQIQKLVHVANGWNLAINGTPLISEPPEAWDNGPVFRRLWDHIRDYGYGTDNCLLLEPSTGQPYAAPLGPSESAVVDHVWRKYGGMSASQLSAMTHEPNTPWYLAYFTFGRGRNSELNNEEIRRHYIDLARAGRESA